MGMGVILRVAIQVVQRVVGQLNQLCGTIEDQALAPMRTIVSAVQGGTWVGEGADAFVKEVSGLMIPGIGKVGEHIQFVSSNLNRAADRMAQADQQAHSMVNALSDTFSGIYSG